jgi:hypothetical protein
MVQRVRRAPHHLALCIAGMLEAPIDEQAIHDEPGGKDKKPFASTMLGFIE